MFALTRDERKALFFICALIFAGAVLRFAIRPAYSAVQYRCESAQSAAVPAKTSVPVKPVNINIAGIEELRSLPGVGPATAEAIITYRDQAGAFCLPDDIMKVKGIGVKKFEKLRGYITVH